MQKKAKKVFDGWKAEDKQAIAAEVDRQEKKAAKQVRREEAKLRHEWRTKLNEQRMQKQRQMQLLAQDRAMRRQRRPPQEDSDGTASDESKEDEQRDGTPATIRLPNQQRPMPPPPPASPSQPTADMSPSMSATTLATPKPLEPVDTLTLINSTLMDSAATLEKKRSMVSAADSEGDLEGEDSEGDLEGEDSEGDLEGEDSEGDMFGKDGKGR
ncbi:hypothetical protein H257_06825 [Aphanomyces astaci]|uniref:Uncharacterized protein n=1 Tax=Aphanomyces astaci TaxID=112090 RepID=W4GJR8_APHAT|nr:hypothetical protein H257_06825 [Aphanomyces astaci]ETV79561.1 hypothetical protein H257_06825 [Aphanomyces astaci]|eukprot:XP_009830497.1 hypothetical protein H257_06825 [Aphanomyces astaci]